MAIQIDYLTITSRILARSDVGFPDDFLPPGPSLVFWQAGAARYEGANFKFSDGSLQIMFSDLQGLLVRISGSLCNRMIPFLDPIRDRIRLRRIDLCFDFPGIIPLQDFYVLQKSAGTKVHATLINGETLYIGSRRSERFWRIYDKSLESHLDSPLFRIECELKGDRAEASEKSLWDLDFRMDLFKNSAIGVVPEILKFVGFPGGNGDYEPLKLPRGKRAGRKFFFSVVLPFLENNGWALDFLEERGYLDGNR